MNSDSEDDYGSKQKYVIDDQIDLFEFRQSMKHGKTKCKIRNIPNLNSTKGFKLSLKITKCQDIKYNQTHKVRQKPVRLIRYSTESPVFECDREFQVTENKPVLTPSIALPKKEEKSSERKETMYHQIRYTKKFTDEQLIDFSSFRHHFYQLNHHLIKSSFNNQSHVKIKDIRPAPVNETVTKYFMKTLKTYSYVPQLVYHGTQMKSIKSILHYGLLVPCKQTPIISGAPVIHSRIGQAYGVGIYCSLNMLVSLTYTSDTNTLLICAALPKRRKHGVIDCCYGDVLVLKEESRIIPLFLLDVKYVAQNHMNHPWFNDGEKK